MIYLKVSYDDRNDAKQLGARFDGQRKQWYAPTGKEAALIAKYGDANAKAEAAKAIDALASQLLPNNAKISDGFKSGQYAFPGYAFRPTSEDHSE